ncbi:hypothetical protein [Devosia sp.]|uniref:hypothetical protein n=1 Tax=Devosia sp. TaxID=1871048 RepID=UPI001AC8F2CC|nr:hypothetical protein [Devosia sp.]MBN9333869.1 hypothetical protein [Devosia sp.]
MPTITGLSVPITCCTIPGGVAGEHKVHGNLKPGDTLISVERLTPGTPITRADLTAEFSISATKAGVVSNTGGTNTTGGFLHISWAKVE